MQSMNYNGLHNSHDFCDSVPDWSQTDDSCIHLFQNELDLALNHVKIPIITAADGPSANYKVIEDYYESVISCIKTACFRTIPQKAVLSYSDYVVPGWNEYVKEKHSEARCAFLDWVSLGRPRC